MTTSRPDWRERIDDTLAAREPRATRRSVGVNYPPALYHEVMEAAKARGMSMAAYQRRAALAFAAHDLGLDWDRVMADEPAFGPFEGKGQGQKHAGQGFGAWKIRDVEL